MWGQEGHPFLQPFLDTLAESYGAGVMRTDFRESPDDAREAINDWVEEHTGGRIEDLIPQGLITVATRMVLANAIYFNAQWRRQFAEDATKMEPFYLLDGGDIDVPMMNATKNFAYSDGDGYQAVRLPYWGGAHMIVIVPDRGNFREFEQSLDAETIRRIVEKLTLHEVTLKIPKFEFESEFKLAKTLRALGMPNAVDSTPTSKADFSGMDGASCIAGDRPCLAIDEVIHKAFVAVDEVGTEAAAATAVVIVQVTGGSFDMPPKAALTVDRPFIFLIRDGFTRSILFLGRVEAPLIPGVMAGTAVPKPACRWGY